MNDEDLAPERLSCPACGRDTAIVRVAGLWCLYEHRTVGPAPVEPLRRSKATSGKDRRYHLRNRVRRLLEDRQRYAEGKQRSPRAAP